MEPRLFMELCFLWACWCGLHSLLIDGGVTGALRRRFPWLVPWYRIGYNLFSFTTFALLAGYTHLVGGGFSYSFGWVNLGTRMMLLGLVLFFYVGGAKGYDLDVFLGLRQLREGRWRTSLTESNSLVSSGVFGITRHPWYFGSILLIWAVFPWLSAQYVAIGLILIIYLIAGSFLEERKLVLEYGEQYRQYQREVSMLLPWKWLRAKCRFHAST